VAYVHVKRISLSESHTYNYRGYTLISTHTLINVVCMRRKVGIKLPCGALSEKNLTSALY
jgi:hypothetical protein